MCLAQAFSGTPGSSAIAAGKQPSQQAASNSRRSKDSGFAQLMRGYLSKQSGVQYGTATGGPSTVTGG